MGSLIGFAILALAAAVVVPDLLRASRAGSNVDRVTGTGITPTGANDPNLLAIESQIAQLSVIVGSIAGRVGAGAIGGTVSGAEAEIGRGLGANPVPLERAQRDLQAEYSTTVAGGTAVGGQTAFAGAAVGGGLVGFLASIPESVARESRAAGITSHYDIPVFGGTYRITDAISSLFGPKS